MGDNREELLAAGQRATGKGRCPSVLVAPDHTGEDNYHNCSGEQSHAAKGRMNTHHCGCGYQWTRMGAILLNPFEESPGNCHDCGWKFTEGESRVLDEHGRGAARCMKCEDRVQHPNGASWHYVARDGKRVSPMFDLEGDAFRWLQQHQPMSNDWAVKYEGYSFKETAGLDTQPMKQDELGKYVCVAPGGCLHSPDITINSGGVWVRSGPGGPVSSAHKDCLGR